MGSACHQLGVYEVLPQIQKLLLKYDLNEHVELKGAFCLGPCSDGIVVHLADQVFLKISADNVVSKFQEEIFPALQLHLTGKEPSADDD